MTEKEFLVDCLRRLNGTGIPYMLTGSMASNYWGVPRTTHDLDLVIRLDTRDANCLVQAFTGDFYIDEAAVEAAFRAPHQFNAVDHRSGLKVDFWLLSSNRFEREMFTRRRQVPLFGESAWICTAEDVILHKLFWRSISPSDRQLSDAAGVFSVQGTALDTDYLKRWGAEIGVSAVLSDLLSGRIRPKAT